MSKKRKNDRPGHWRYKYEKKGLTLSTLTEKIKKAVSGYSSLPNRRPIPNKIPGCRKYQKLIRDHYLIVDQVEPWVQNQ